jgi:allophanate hydrolase subunit 1
MSAAPEIVPLGATALLARFGDRIDRDLTARIARLVDRLADETGAGIVDLVPSYTTLVVLVDPSFLRVDAAAALCRRITSSGERPQCRATSSRSGPASPP